MAVILLEHLLHTKPYMKNFIKVISLTQPLLEADTMMRSFWREGCWQPDLSIPSCCLPISVHHAATALETGSHCVAKGSLEPVIYLP